MILENYSFCILLGPPPWEDNTVYKTVNGYHYEALKKFSHLTKGTIHKLRRQERGRGVWQMSMLLHKLM